MVDINNSTRTVNKKLRKQENKIIRIAKDHRDSFLSNAASF